MSSLNEPVLQLIKKIIIEHLLYTRLWSPKISKTYPCPPGVQHEHMYRNSENEELEMTRSEQTEKAFLKRW